jgi:hypothetical protein
MVKLSNLPPDLKKEYEEECKRKQGQPQESQSVVIVITALEKKDD